MGIYLFDEQPIIANKTLARELGLNEALVLQQINYWIEINKKSGNNFHEGKYWTYNSIRLWQEKDFDYMSVDTVKRTFAKLEKIGFLLVGNFNKDPRDKTKWYTINEEKLAELYLEIENKKLVKEKEILEKSIPNALGQNALMEKGKMHQCNNADCTNASEQNLSMHKGNLHQPLPEITTKSSSEITSYISTDNSTHQPTIGIKENLFLDSRNENGRKGGMVDIINKNKYKDCLEEFRKQVGYYEHLKVGNKMQAREYDEIIKILADVMVLENGVITINQIKLKVEFVQERFRELRYDHLEYLVSILRDNEYKIRNIRSFVLTAAYNAPSNMDAHYTALVNYDMRGGY